MTGTMIEQLRTLDRSLFLAINGAHAAWADVLMHTVSQIATWIPLYVFLLYMIRNRWGSRGLWWSLPVIAAMIWCTDSGSVLLFKNTVQRLRPCHAPEMAGLVRAIDGCGGSFGFVSSHASNHFGIAAYMIGVLRCTPRWSTWTLLSWAALISYSRIYLGVHYPGDVISGGLYGFSIGTIFALLFQRIMDRSNQ
jgi:undecaprenyl-diphosphatase